MTDDKQKQLENNLKSILLANPFSKVGMEFDDAHNTRMSEKEFFENLYAPLMDEDTFENPPESLENNRKIAEFENNVKNASKPLLGIVGSAGTGKTTYLNHLKYKFNSSDLSLHIIDLSSASVKRIRFLNATIDMSDEALSDFSMLFVALAKYISTLLTTETNSISAVITSYRKWTRESDMPMEEKVEEFFSVLESSLHGRTAETEKEFGTALSQFLSAIFKSATKKEEAISDILKITICIMASLAHLGKRQICAIDNIEYLIRIENNIIVNDNLIKKIWNLVADTIDRTKDYNAFLDGVIFIFVARKTSLKSPQIFHSNANRYAVDSLDYDGLPDFLDLNGIFTGRNQEIITKRIEFAINRGKIDKSQFNSAYIHFLKLILADESRSKWSMNTIISKLCNYNKRRITQILIGVISTQSIEEITSFCQKWDLLQKNDDKEMKHYYRRNFANMIVKYCRQIESSSIVDQNALNELVQMLSGENTKNKSYKIFVCSTFVNLMDERASIIQNIIKLGYIPVGMEMFSASNESTWDTIKGAIDESDYFLLVVGERYGAMNEEGHGYIEIEFDYANTIGLPIFTFIHRKFEILSSDNHDANKNSRLDKLKRKIADSRFVTYWDSLEQLFMKMNSILVDAIKHNSNNFNDTLSSLNEVRDSAKESDILDDHTDSYKDQIDKEIKHLAHDDVGFFAWLCAIRALPYLGAKGHFDFWMQSQNRDDRQKHLLAVFRSLDMFDNDECYSIAEDVALSANNAANAATKADAADIADVVFASAYSAYATYEYSDSGYGDDAYVAINAAINVGDWFGVDMRAIINQDLATIKSGHRNFQSNTNIYGEIWDNFQKALRDVGCEYWGEWYAALFANEFILDDADVAEIEVRLNAPEEIKKQGAKAVANYMEQLNNGRNQNPNYKLCFGTYTKVLHKYGNNDLSAVKIVNILVQPIDINYEIKAGTAMNLSECKDELPASYVESIAKISHKSVIEYFKTNIVNQILQIEHSHAVIALCEIIKSDNSISEDTIVDLISGTTKKALRNKRKFELSNFLAGVFLYVVSSTENRMGINTMICIDEDFWNTLIPEQGLIEVIETSIEYKSKYQKRFKVALSFSGEQRHLVDEIAQKLADVYGKEKILYDKYHAAEFARPDFKTYIENLYVNEVDLLVVFIDYYYAKNYDNNEWFIIHSILNKNGSNGIMLIKVDDVAFDAGTDVVDVSTEFEIGRIIESIVERLELLESSDTDALHGYMPSKIVTNDYALKPVEHFTGREKECKAIRDCIEGNTGIVLINGVAAIGKTEICKNCFLNIIGEQEKKLAISVGQTVRVAV